MLDARLRLDLEVKAIRAQAVRYVDEIAEDLKARVEVALKSKAGAVDYDAIVAEAVQQAERAFEEEVRRRVRTQVEFEMQARAYALAESAAADAMKQVSISKRRRKG